MLVLGIFIGLWVGAPLGFVIAAMLGPREREELDPRAMQDLLARRFPSAPATSDGAERVSKIVDENRDGRRHAR